MTKQPPLTPKDAQQYLAELISEYMKTLPPPIRMPVIQTVNGCMECIAAELSDCKRLRGNLKKPIKGKK